MAFRRNDDIRLDGQIFCRMRHSRPSVGLPVEVYPMSRETEWISRLEAIRDKLGEAPNADWMSEWRAFSSIIEEAAAVHPKISEWLPVAC